MTQDKTAFSHPVTKVVGRMAVPRSLPGVFPASVAVLAIDSFRKDFPCLAARLESIREFLIWLSLSRSLYLLSFPSSFWFVLLSLVLSGGDSINDQSDFHPASSGKRPAFKR